MNITHAMVRAFGICLMGGAVACALRPTTPSSSPFGPTTRTTVVLLPEIESGRTGRVTVHSGGSALELNTPGQSTEVREGAPPSTPQVLDATRIRSLFGDALSALPPSPRVFTLYFRFESEQLVDISQAELATVLQSISEYPAPDITVVGHTDTAGSSARNMALGRQRAEVVKKLLVQVGLDSASIEVVSHGETDPIVRTQDGTPEPRNRRVDLVVR